MSDIPEWMMEKKGGALDKQVREAVEGIQKTGLNQPQTNINYDQLRTMQQRPMQRPPVQQQQVPPWMQPPPQRPQAPPQSPWQPQAPSSLPPPSQMPGIFAGEALAKKKRRLLAVLWVIFFLTLACTLAVAVYFFVMAK